MAKKAKQGKPSHKPIRDEPLLLLCNKCKATLNFFNFSQHKCGCSQ